MTGKTPAPDRRVTFVTARQYSAMSAHSPAAAITHVGLISCVSFPSRCWDLEDE